MIIRKANVSDAEGIAKVHVDTWRTTYKGILSDNFLNQLSYEQRTELWKNNISRIDNHVYVVENSDGDIIGFTDGGKRDTNNVANSGNLTSIYILEEFQGMGLGKRLLKELFTNFIELEYNSIFVEVLEDNKSRYFYEALGANLTESERIKIAGKELNLLTYKWEDIRSVKLA